MEAKPIFCTSNVYEENIPNKVKYLLLLFVTAILLNSCKNCGDDTDLVPVVFSFSFTDSNGNDIFLGEGSSYLLDSLKFLNDNNGRIWLNEDSSCFLMSEVGPGVLYIEFIPSDLDTLRFESIKKDKCTNAYKFFFNDSLVCEDCGGRCYTLYK